MEKIGVEVHEHPVLNGVYHQAVWVYQWADNKTGSEVPEDCPVVCAVCGKVRT